ncbi:MAG TPA: hypothetical protein VET85_09195 [Stellaceae bacterium]|nr:hypothetical protein [Stellaceae bacterium]
MAVALLVLFAGGEARAHGGLSMDKDYCKLRIGPHLMHFTGFQPQGDYSKEFCEDIPAIGPTIIVLDFIDDALRDMPTEVRIIKASADEADIERATVFHLPPKTYSAGSLSLDYTFVDAGNYVGLVTVGDGDHKMVARFPFAVGSSNRLRNSIALVVLAIALGGGYGYWRLRGSRKAAV